MLNSMLRWISFCVGILAYVHVIALAHILPIPMLGALTLLGSLCLFNAWRLNHRSANN